MKDDGSNTDTTGGSSDIVSTAVLAPGLGKISRAFAAIPYMHQPTTRTAGKVIGNYTLHQKPLLIPGEVLLLIENACSSAQTGNCQMETMRKVDSYVRRISGNASRITDNAQLKSIHTRTRAHLVAECRANITKIFGINQLAKEDITETIAELLEGDRFICRQATQVVSSIAAYILYPWLS